MSRGKPRVNSGAFHDYPPATGRAHLHRDERSIGNRPPLTVADGPEGKEGSPPDSPDDHHPLRKVASDHDGGAENPRGLTGAQRMETLTLPDVIMAILDSRSRFLRAASAAVIREPDGADVFVYVVLLDKKRQPIFVEPGIITAVTYVTRHLDADIRAAFGDRMAIILQLVPAARGAGRAGSRSATAGPDRGRGAPGTFDAAETNRRIDVYMA